MITIIQRVSSACVKVDNEIIGEISQGVVALLGFHKLDDKNDIAKFIDKLLAYRVFSDNEGKMNLSLNQTNKELLIVPQFTIAAETNKGLRPSFSSTLNPSIAEEYFNIAVDYAKNKHAKVACGKFGADMQVSLTNDGPVTFVLSS